MPLHPGQSSASAELRDPSDASRERAWVDAVRTSEVAAFEAMFTAYAEPLCAFVYGYVQSQDEARELVHDLFFWIWDHRHEWEVPGSLRTYLFKAARNRALSWVRHRVVERRFAQAAQQEGTTAAPRTQEPDQQVLDGELAAAVDRAVAALPERCREVFQLNRRQQLTYAEIAAVLRISVRTVEVHMGRALVALRRSLADWR